MPEHAPGTLCWVDLASPDTDASAAFYGALFGWSVTAADESMGGYRRFSQDGADVAGLVPIMTEGHPPSWTSYVATADADATAEAVKAAGGTMVFEPMDVREFGRMAAFTDPAGAFLGVWQAYEFAGAALKDAPNSLTWNEVITSDLEGAKAFYGKVFGWTPGPGPVEMPDEYVVWMLGDQPVGGAMAFNDRMPEGIPPHWGVCFAVADADVTTARAEELGATIDMPVTEMSVGRFSVMRDPHGASFSTMQLAEPAA